MKLDLNSSTSRTIGTILLASTPLLLYHCGPRLLLIYKAHVGRRRLRSLAASQQPDTSTSSTDKDGDGNNTNNKPTVSAIYIHPIKSLRPISLPSTTFDKHGLSSDRSLMIVRPNPPPIYGSFLKGEATHRFVTQRQCSKLATIDVSPPIVMEDGKKMIKLSCSSGKDEKKEVYVDISSRAIESYPIRYTAGIWSDIVQVADVGDEAATFVAEIASMENSGDGNTVSSSFGDLRVVAILENTERRIDERYCPVEARVGWGGWVPQSGLTDGFPILVAAESSLTELNRRLEEKNKKPIPMSRFRPNIVISNTQPFEEDTWKAIQIGSGPNAPILHIAKGCPRCKQSCTDQLTGERSEEPLETLADFRAHGEDVYFAQNAVLNGDCYDGRICVGDEVRILTRGDPVWDLEEVSPE